MCIYLAFSSLCPVLGQSHGWSHSENSKDSLMILNSRRNPNNTEKIFFKKNQESSA